MPKVVKPKRFPWRLVFTLAAWGLVAGSTAYAARRVQEFVFTDKHFALGSPVTLEGVRYTSRPRLMQMFTPDFGRSAFRMPMAERRRRLLAIDWVEDASISRIWPNRVLVHITERKPVAFVNMPNGRYLLIDAAGVFLSPPSKMRFNLPVLSGVTEEMPEGERSARVGAMSSMVAQLGELAGLISEINAASLLDLRVTTQVDHHAVELWMGDRNFLPRYQNFMHHYAEISQTSPAASVFDLRLDDRITTK
jgi:cell division protein FtsQ